MFIVCVNWYYTSTCAHFHANIFAVNIFNEKYKTVFGNYLKMYTWIFILVESSCLYDCVCLVSVYAGMTLHDTYQITSLSVRKSFSLFLLSKTRCFKQNTISLLQIFGNCYSLCHGVHWSFKEYLMDCIWEISKVRTFLTLMNTTFSWQLRYKIMSIIIYNYYKSPPPH